MDNSQQVTILLVEDDPGHARLIEKNLRRSNITKEIVTIGDGQEAVDYLSENPGPLTTTGHHCLRFALSELGRFEEALDLYRDLPELAGD